MSDPVSVAGLGLAVFSAGREYATSGAFSSTTDTPSYMHPGTPSSVAWGRVNTRVRLSAFHPRIGWGRQVFVFQLMYEYNGYDIRNARVEPLVDASSGMYTSSFTINWRGQAHSRPKDTVAEIVFNFSGEWDPHGRGHVSFSGELIISGAKNGRNFEAFTMLHSERNWVRVEP